MHHKKVLHNFTRASSKFNCHPAIVFFFFFPWCSLCSASDSKPRRPYILLLTKLLTRPDEVSGLSMIFLLIKYLYFPSCSGVTILLTCTPSLLHSPTPALPRSLAPLLPLSFIPSLFHSFTLSFTLYVNLPTSLFIIYLTLNLLLLFLFIFWVKFWLSW